MSADFKIASYVSRLSLLGSECCVSRGKQQSIWARRRLLLQAVVIATTLAVCVISVAAADQAPIPFQVPEGFVAEQVASSPLIEHPMFACFDDNGRLLVTDSRGINLITRDDLVHIPANLVGVPEIPRVREALINPPMLIRQLEDNDGDGNFEKSSVFADRLTYPQGILWHDGAVYTVSPPGLWQLRDTDGDGVADQRDELVKGLILTGAADDAHGPCLGPDGLLYWCHGRFAHELKGRDGAVVARGPGPRIYRCRPNGTEVEMLSASQGNAVEVAFTDEGEAFASGTLFFREGSGPLRDALIHCVEGGVFPVLTRSDVEGHRTGDLLPELLGMSATSPSGLMRYRSGGFGASDNNNLFMALFGTHGVQRVAIEHQGATFRARLDDFIASSSPDFHPTDVLEDADGSLLVVDTGTWFENCPTAGLGKMPVSGGVYRIRRKNAVKLDDPRGLRLNWDRMEPAELKRLLDDPRWMVRDRAIDQLAKHGPEALPVLQASLRTENSLPARRNALWTLARIEGVPARKIVCSALADEDASVRLTAIYIVGLHRDAKALAKLQELLKDTDPAVRREAATAVGRIGQVDAVPALFAALRTVVDRFLEHAIIYAIIRIDDRDATLAGLADPSPLVRRAALIALDQMDHGELTRELVAPHLGSSDAALQKVAIEIVASRPGWSDAMIGLLRQWLAETELQRERQESLAGAIVAFAKDEAVQTLIAQTLAEPRTSSAMRLLLLETMSRTVFDQLPATWIEQLGRHLNFKEERIVRQAIANLASAKVADFDEQLVKIARDSARTAELRIAALGAVASRLAHLEPVLFDFALNQLDPQKPPLERMAAAKALGSLYINDQQLVALAGAIVKAGPLELPSLLMPFERSHDSEVGRQLLASLNQSPGLTSLPPELLRRTLTNYPQEIQASAEPILKRLSIDTEKQKARLGELEAALHPGDHQRGRQVFFGKSASCFACHSVEGQGGQVGPDLSKIAQVRSARDLLEAIAFPSASFARGYEPYSVVTVDGRVHSGVIRRETAEAIHLITADRTELRLPRSEIEAVQPARVSVMPQGLDVQLTPQELSDLIAFLVTLK